MSDESTAVAAPSPAPEATPAATPNLEIPRSNTPEYDEWRKTGKLPEKKQEQPKPQAQEATGEEGDGQDSDDSADSAATHKQEQENKQGRRRPDVEARIKQLTDELKRTRAELDEVRKPKTQAESSPAQTEQPPQNYKDWRKSFKPVEWVEQYGKDHPDASYEEATAAMADYLGDMRDQFRSIEQQRESQAQELNRKVADARQRYGETFNDVLVPTLNAVLGDTGINANVKAMLNDSEVIADLIYTIGSDSKTLSDFIEMAKSNPGKALRYIAVVEHGIMQELAGKQGEEGDKGGRNEKGQFVAKSDPEPPAKRGPESAPAPPIEIGSRGSTVMDESERALKDMERGDKNAFSRWKEAEDRKDLARRRGA